MRRVICWLVLSCCFFKVPLPSPPKKHHYIYIYTHLKTNKQMKNPHLCCICCILILPLYFLFLQRSGCRAQWWQCCSSSAVSSSPSWALGCTAVPSTHTSVAPWVTWLTMLTSTCATSTTSTPPPNTSSLHDRRWMFDRDFSVDDELRVCVCVDNTAISLTPAPAGVVCKLELEHRFVNWSWSIVL